jgi:hypothetical protein
VTNSKEIKNGSILIDKRSSLEFYRTKKVHYLDYFIPQPYLNPSAPWCALKFKMNSKILQDKVQEIEDEVLEMRLLKRSEKGSGQDGKEKSAISTSQLTVSLKHYDQVR